MRIALNAVVITTPPVVVSAADAKAAGVFLADDDDTMITALLAAAQSTIDGPDGWLGRAIGLQTLEVAVTGACLALRLPCPPIRSITSVKYLDAAGVDQTISPSDYSLDGRVLTFTGALPTGTMRVRFQAGYGLVDGNDLPVPPAIRHAIMLMAGQLKSLSPSAEGDILREDITGVGSTVYAAAKSSENALRTAAENLLSTYRVFQ